MKIIPVVFIVSNIEIWIDDIVEIWVKDVNTSTNSGCH